MHALEEYSIGERLYQSKRFEIFKGYKKSDQQKVILKICNTNPLHLVDLVALQHEYQILKQLDLAGIISVYELISLQDKLILVLEDMDGESLQQYLTQQEIDITKFFKIAIQLVDAIGELHLHHIIHKNINPSNIIINPKTLKVKLADFGVSSQLMSETQDYDQVIVSEGTLAYISPEQTGRMNRAVDYRSDFYSLGVTFYEMLTGQLPFKSEDNLELIHHHLTLIPKLASTINPKIPLMLEAIISKLLSKTPEGRYWSAIGLKADLSECQAQWENNNDIKSFSLGEYDIQDHLVVSQKLYGREEQVNQLLDTFERVSHGKTECVFISGYSGVGKTSLVKEISRSIVRKYGYFISGKYDQLRRATPYTGIIEAFNGLVNHYMTESEERLKILREALQESLGNNGQVIVNIIPSLELILGPQEPVYDLTPTETQNRLTLTFLNFVRVLAQPDHPLVMFLDDIQWIDNASLQLLNQLMSDDIRYFLLIGSYRDNEVTVSHPLIMLQQNFKKNNVLMQNLVLSPLKRNDIKHLIEDSFTSSPEEIPQLANLLLEKTQGNPYFINEFLKTLYSEKQLIFSYTERMWKWNIKNIQELSVTDNVIDLLLTRITQLPDKTQKLLQLAACIGHKFDLLTLSIICEFELAETARYILEATIANFIIPVNENYWLLESISANAVDLKTLHSNKINYRFIHDKVQQAAYQLIPEDQRRQVHLKIGRLLLKNGSLHEKDENLFEILNHFNYCLNDIADTQEKLNLAKYNLWAGKKAKISSAYQAAKEYLSAGLYLLNGVDLSLSYELRNSFLKELATCQYLTGEYEKAESSFNQLLQSAKETLSTLEIYKLNCEMLSTLNRHQEAIQLGLKVLASVNISIPENPTLVDLLWAITRVKFACGTRKLNNITFPVMESKQNKAISDLISQLLNSAFITNYNLFVIFACINVRLSLRYGYTDSTAFSCLVYAFTVMHGLNLYDEGMEFYNIYNKLSSQFPQKNFEGRNYFVVGAFIEPWRDSLDKSINVLQKSYQYLYDSGDLVYSNYCNLTIAFQGYMAGKPLSEVKVYIQNATNFMQKTKTKDFYLLSELWNYIYLCISEDCFAIEKIHEFEESTLANKSNTEISFFYAMATKLCYQFDNFNEAKRYGAMYKPYVKYSLGLVCTVEGYFYYALALSALCTSKNKRPTLRELYKIRSRFTRWASWCSINYQQYLLLLDAEIARIRGDVTNAIRYYQSAITFAQQHNTLNIAALANECCGRFYMELSSENVAKLYFKEAYEIYRTLGMISKFTKYEKSYPEFNPLRDESEADNQNGINPETSLDMLSLMRSSQLISGEIELDKLLQKLLLIVLQNAGADRGLLLSKDESNWFIEAEGTISEQRISLTHVEPITRRSDLPLSLIFYVQRTKKYILVQDAKSFESLMVNDEYLSLMQPKSVLAMPIFFHGELQSILYLENRMVDMAFKKEQVDILQILSSQAAISLQNAKLYYQATHDSLTGLSNRNLLYQMFNLAVNKSNRMHTSIAIILLDLDLFKIVNDTLGHHVGDQLLLYIADLLKSCLRKEDLLTRLGGDEFVAMVEYNNVKEVCNLAERFLEHIRNPIELAGHEINMTISVGISLFPDDSSDISELLKQADMALYRVKTTGKNHFQFYTSSLDQQIKQQYKDEIELRQALENNELCIYYQPVFTAIDHNIAYFEALVRWNHPQRGLIDAKYFIPLAEKTGLVVSLGKWVLKAALEQIKAWRSAGINPVPVAVNISGIQFKIQRISELVTEILQQTKVEAKYLQLEFTESVSIEYTDKVLEDIAELKKIGIKLLLDDFGTYYSSLSYLREGVVDKLKIDQTFVKGINEGTSDIELITAIINLAHSLNLKVVAEGIETREQMMFLEEHHIDELQGFFLGRPMSAEACISLLKNTVHEDST